MKKLSELYAPKPPGEKAFVKKHKDAAPAVAKNSEPTKDDARFKGTNVKTFNRKVYRFGYDADAAEKAYGVGGDIGVNDERPETGIAPYTVKEDAIEEGLRLLHTYQEGPHMAKVYKDHEWNEHRVKFYHNGKYQDKADYHTDDAKDAHDTAQYQLRLYGKGKLSEEDEADKKKDKKELKNDEKICKLAKKAEKHDKEEMKEHLAKDASASDYIHDFVHSKNSKFAGESKKQRIKRALGAYYGKHESEDELSDEDVIETLFDILDDMLGEQIEEETEKPKPVDTRKSQGYSAVAVQKEIDRHNRRSKSKIGKKEREMIHRLLRGRD